MKDRMNSFVVVFAVLLGVCIYGISVVNIPEYYRKLKPLVASDHLIVSLNSITRPLQVQYSAIDSHQLISIGCNDTQQTVLREIQNNDTFMYCANKESSAPFHLICIEQKTWDVRTRSNFQPPQYHNALCSLLLQMNGRDINGKQKVTKYRLKLTIQARCKEQLAAYNNLKKECTPKLKELKQEIINNTYTYSIEGNDVNKYIKLVLLKFPQNSVKGFLDFRVRCERDSNTHPTYSKESTVEISSSNNMYVNVNCQPGTNKVNVQILGNWSLTGLYENQLVYFTMNEFCANKQFLILIRQWWYQLSRSKESEQCSTDSFGFLQLFKECHAPPKLVVESSTSDYKRGKPLVLTCRHSKVFVPTTIRWEIIQGNKMYKLKIRTRELNISNLSCYPLKRFYKCRIYAYYGFMLQQLNEASIKIELSDVFNGQLSFLLPRVRYRPAWKYQRYLRTSRVRKSIERNIIHSITENQTYNPTFNVLSFKNISGGLLVTGELGTCNSDVHNWTYIVWMAYTITQIKQKFSYSTIRNVSLLTKGGCSSLSENVDGHIHNFPFTREGSSAIIPCDLDITNHVIKTCTRKMGTQYARWYDNVTQCNYTTKIYDLLFLSHIKVDASNALSVSSKLLLILSEEIDISADKITLATNILRKFVGFTNTSTKVEDNIMDSIDIVMNATKTSMVESEKRNNSATHIVQLLGDFGEDISTTNVRVINRMNFVLSALKTNVDTFNGVSVNMRGSDNATKVIQMRAGSYFDNDRGMLASIHLPPSITDSLKPSEDVIDIIAVGYHKDHIFVPNSKTNETKQDGRIDIINSPILSTEIRGHKIRNLHRDPVQLQFKLIHPSNNNTCVYWDFIGQEWSRDGCSMVNHTSDTIMCACTHLTNFAVLFSTIPPTEGLHRDVLSYITYLGLGISFVGAMLTMLTYLIFPMLRRKVPPKILINLCAAFIMMEVCFIIGDKSRLPITACKISSFFLQYFFLTVFTWSAVEGFQSYRSIVHPLSEEIRNFMQKAMLFGWGLPLVMAVIGVIMSLEDYNGNTWCMVTGMPFYITVLAPIVSILCFNIISLVTITITLFCKNKVTNSKPMGFRVRFRIVTGFIVLFGVTWVFGFFVISSSNIVYQYLFCILSSIQGLYLFVFYCIRVKKNRWAWCKLIKCQPLREIQRLHTRKSQISRCNTCDVSSPMVNSLSNSSSMSKFTSLLSSSSRKSSTPHFGSKSNENLMMALSAKKLNSSSEKILNSKSSDNSAE